MTALKTQIQCSFLSELSRVVKHLRFHPTWTQQVRLPISWMVIRRHETPRSETRTLWLMVQQAAWANICWVCTACPPNPTGRCVCVVDRDLEFGEPDLRTVRMSSLCSGRRHCIFHADCHSTTLLAVQISLCWKDVPKSQRHMENDLSIIWWGFPGVHTLLGTMINLTNRSSSKVCSTCLPWRLI